MMTETSEVSLSSSLYEEDLNEETTLDLSSRGLVTVPELNNKQLRVIYLQSNELVTLPEDFFPSLPNLMWLDLRDNRLTDIPKSIKQHPSLTHLLLQNNCLTSLPDELGTVNLKALQLNGNPLMYPPREVINEGLPKILKFLNDKYSDAIFTQSQSDMSEDNVSNIGNISLEGRSYNSVMDEGIKNYNKNKTKLSIQFSEKEVDSDDEVYYDKVKGKCPKLDKSRHKPLPAYYQSAKYLKPLLADGQKTKDQKIKQNYLKDLAIKKHKELLATREKILQNRKNTDVLKNWRMRYRYQQPYSDGTYRLEAGNFPYDTNPDYMTFLSREDIEKDLPDKYRKSLTRRARPTRPRKINNDVHLAMKIKQLFDNLEAIDLNKEGLTPRTEQKMLLNEIQKITEIKQKLNELSIANQESVPPNVTI